MDSDLNEKLIEVTAQIGGKLESVIKVLSAVSRISSVLVVTEDMEGGSVRILDTILRELDDVANCSLLVFDERAGFLKLLAAKGQADFFGENGGPYNKNIKFTPGEGVAGQVFQSGEPVFYSRHEVEEKFIQTSTGANPPNALACLPLISNDRRLGILNISFSQDRVFEISQKRNLILLSEIIANIIRSYMQQQQLIDTSAELKAKAVRLEREVRSRRLAEEEKDQLKTQLREAQKMEAVGTLSGGIAHEFNNFLQGMIGYVQLLKEDHLPPEKQREYLNEIDAIADQAASLVRGLMAFSRKWKPTLTPINIKEIVDRANKIIKAALPQMILIETRVGPDLPYIKGDGNQIEQVLLNLATNARDAMPNGGTIRISAERQTLDKKFCSRNPGSRKGDYVRLDFNDNGTGIPPKILPRIFEPFLTSKKVGEGTGLGLSVVYGIVKTHQGYIKCESQLGTGTTFRIWFPECWEKPAEPSLSLSADADIPTGNETILLVDDMEAILEVTKIILSSSGYQVYTASDGKTALEVFQKNKESIDLILLDLVMPGVGGEKCLERILEEDPKAKIIITSGKSLETIQSELLGKGASGFIRKPFRKLKLLQEIRSILDSEKKPGQ